MKSKFLMKMFCVVACLLCFIGADAAEAYAELSHVTSPSGWMLTFYYDDYWASREGEIYALNSGMELPGWYNDGNYEKITYVSFDPSFANARPTSTCGWFYGMYRLRNIYSMKSYLNTSEVTVMTGMFAECERLSSINLSAFNTSKVKYMDSMFRGCSGLTSLDVSGFNTAQVVDMYQMFEGCRGLTSLTVSNFNTSHVTDMSSMFAGCSGLETLDLSHFNTSQVANMSGMFFGCISLLDLDLSNFNTSNVLNMAYMFEACTDLTTIYAGNAWSTAAVIDSDEMFDGCTALMGSMGTTYDANHVDKAYARIDGGSDNPGYFTAAPTSVTGDVDGSGNLEISDVTSLIDYILSHDADGIIVDNADVDNDAIVSIADVTVIIDYILSRGLR